MSKLRAPAERHLDHFMRASKHHTVGSQEAVTHALRWVEDANIPLLDKHVFIAKILTMNACVIRLLGEAHEKLMEIVPPEVRAVVEEQTGLAVAETREDLDKWTS